MRITSSNAYMHSFGRENKMLQQTLYDTNGEIHEPISNQTNHMSEFWTERNTLARPAPKPAPVIVPLEDQMIFWNYLNDVQYGQLDESKLVKANTWVITHNGTWLIQKNSSGYYGTQKNKSGIPTLPKAELPESFFELTFGKIPNSILEQIVAFFREVMKRHNDAEAFVQVYWDKQESKYVVHVPKQRISKASVHYDALENLNNKQPERYVFVYECHSHNSMGAFWSGTDNADEKELRVYGVFGQLNKDTYACLHRFFVAGEMIEVELGHVFNLPANENKKFLVMHNNKQYLVPGDKLQLDEKPKYIFTNEKGETTYVPLDKVVQHKDKVDFPETWFGNVNVPVFHAHGTNVKHTYANQVTNFAKKDKPKHRKGMDISYDRYGRMLNDETPEAASHYLNDPYHYHDGPLTEADKVFADTAQEIEEHIDELSDLTNGFEDPTAMLIMLEALEGKNMLYELMNQINTYVDIGTAQDVNSSYALS